MSDALKFFRTKKFSVSPFLKGTRIYHMEEDESLHDHILFTYQDRIGTTNGTKAKVVAWASNSSSTIEGFTQLSAQQLVFVESKKHCLYLFDRQSKNISAFAGECEEGLRPLYSPTSLHRDIVNNSQVFIINLVGKIFTVNLDTQSIELFVENNNIYTNAHMTQNDKGDVYFTSRNALYRVGYINRHVELLSGYGGDCDAYLDGSLNRALYSNPSGLLFITPDILLIADRGNNKLRLVDLKSNRVSTLDVCLGCKEIKRPYTLLLLKGSLYIGHYCQGISVFKGEFVDSEH